MTITGFAKDRMKDLMSEFPGGGFVVALVESVDKAQRETKDVDDQLAQLDSLLSTWLEDNDSTTTTDAEENVESVVDKVRETIKEFHKYIQDKRKERSPENMRTHDQIKERIPEDMRTRDKIKAWLRHHFSENENEAITQRSPDDMRTRDKIKAWFRDLLHENDNEAITQRILVFKQEIQLSMYRLIIDSYELTRKIDDTTCRIEKNTVTILEVIEDLRSGGVDLSENEIELMTQIDKGDSNDDDSTKLMRLFSKKPANERLELSLQLIRLDDDNAKVMGLSNLDRLLHKDSNGLVIDRALNRLIELARDVNEKVKEKASVILKTIAEKNELKTQFFKCVLVLSESEANRQAIAETIAVRIVDCARNVRGSKKSPERDAFRALRMLVNTKSCRLAIAEAEGISALAEIYKGTAELREWKTNKQAIDELIALARYDESQGRFANETIWPLFHYIDKVRNQYDPLEISYDEDGQPERDDPDIHEVDPSDQKRVQRAGEALWQLSLIDKFKPVIISLSKVESINDIDSILEKAPDNNGFDDLYWWAKWMENIDLRKFYCDRIRDGYYGSHLKNKNLSQVELFSTICNSFRNLLWSLVLDRETAVAVAACWYDTRPKEHQFRYMENVDPEYCGYWVKSVLHHVGFPEKKSFMNVSRCMKLLLKKLSDSNASAEQIERAAKVLWFCSLAETVNEEVISSSFSKNEADVVERCGELIQTGTPTQIFWATGILANLTWCKANPKDVAAAAVKGARRIVETESKEFVFLARYVADRQPGFVASVENEGLYFDSSFYDELH